MRDIVKDLKYFHLGFAYADVEESIDNREKNSFGNIDTVVENLRDCRNFIGKALDGKKYSGPEICNTPFMYDETIKIITDKNNFYTRGDAIVFREKVSELILELDELKETPELFHGKSHKNLSLFLDSMGTEILNKAPQFVF